MEKITRKAFTEILTENSSVFAGSFFRANDEGIIEAMENVKAIPEKAMRRTVTEKHSNYIVFSNGSRLDFDQQGEKEYFKHTNNAGINFIFQRTKAFDDFDGKYYQHYVAYAIA